MNSQQEIFNEAKAFFHLFAQSPWAMCHVRADAVEIFASRTGELVDPMAAAADVLAPTGAVTELRAPHLGTLSSVADVGTNIAAGQTYGRLELLGHTIDLVADFAGVVMAHQQAPGALIEYDQVIVRLSP